MTAPGQTSRHAISLSGNHLNSRAKSSVSTPKETAKFVNFKERALTGRTHPRHAARPVLMTSEMASRPPRAKMPAQETA